MKLQKIRFSVLIAIFTILLNKAYAQLNDIPDYRNKKESFVKLTDKAFRSDLAVFTLGGIIEAVSKEPLEKIPIKDYGSDYIHFANDSIEIMIKSGVFLPANHKLVYYDDKYLTRIDNKPYWGIYGKVPKTSIESLTILVSGDTVAIPTTAFNDIYEPKFCVANANSNTAACNSAVYFSRDKRTLYIYMLNSDGTTGYEVTWIIHDRQYIRRVVDYDF